KSLMYNLQPVSKTPVLVANGGVVYTELTGDVDLRSATAIVTLKAHYVPNFTTNLISVSAAEDRGVDVSYQNRVWTFKRDNLILFTGVRKNGIFQCCLAKSVFINWHERLGHLSDSKLS